VIARCNGRTSPSGRPVACCVLCERRSYAPSTPQTVWVEPEAKLIGNEWHCVNRVHYLQDSGFDDANEGS
jgi:hypothetical protein